MREEQTRRWRERDEETIGKEVLMRRGNKGGNERGEGRADKSRGEERRSQSFFTRGGGFALPSLQLSLLSQGQSPTQTHTYMNTHTGRLADAVHTHTHTHTHTHI